MRITEKKLNNRGSSLVAVIIAMLFFSVLGALMLATGVMGYQMKIVEAGAKANQYSTESILNQVSSGLQELSETKLKEAYTFALTRYSATLEEKKTALLREKYVDFMEEILTKKAGADSVAGYNVSDDGTSRTLKLTELQRGKLIAWLNTLKVQEESSFVKDNGETELVFIKAGGKDFDEYSVTLTNITAAYQDQTYSTEITTDIKLSAPEAIMGFTSGEASAKNLASYGVISDQTVRTATTSQVTGNLYAGKAILAENGANLRLEGEKVLTRGDITARGGSRLSVTGNGQEPCQVWADNIKTEKSGKEEGTQNFNQLYIDGICNIANDMNLNNPLGDVKLLGEYYGYGTIESMRSVTYGSSIAVNAAAAQLDLSDLKKLHLSGRTAISVEATNQTGVQDSVTPVMQGEAISYKWTQNAYLLPGDCLPGIGHNPMTLEEYNGVFQELTGAEKFNITRYVPISLRKHLDPTNPYTEIFVKHSIGEAETGIMVYLYMNFISPSYASNYFQEYANSLLGKTELGALATLMDFRGILMPKDIQATDGSDEKMQAAGNIVNYEEGSLNADGSVGTDGEVTVSGGAMYTENVFSNVAIDKIYSRNGLVSYLDEKKRIANPTATLVSNLINVSMLEEAPVKEEDFIAQKGDLKISGPFEGIILVDGDVEVSGAVKGMIIATGDITINNAEIKADGDVLTNAINKGIEIHKYFRADLGYTVSPGEPGSGEQPEEEKKYDRIRISFENWRRS